MRTDAANSDIYHQACATVQHSARLHFIGVGIHDACRLYKRIYGGLVSSYQFMIEPHVLICLTQMDPGDVYPNELGYAAAFEAYRSWKFHGLTYGMREGSLAQQHEVLVALAVAQSTRSIHSGYLYCLIWLVLNDLA
jgi:hypothetical protein